MPRVLRPDGTAIFYEHHQPSDGGRATILLLSGLGMSTGMWVPVVQVAVERGYSVIVTDSRGTGRSTTPRRPWTTATMANDATAVLDMRGVAKAHIGGVSLGGMVAQQVALRHPRRVETLILGSTTAGMLRPGHLPHQAVRMLVSSVRCRDDRPTDVRTVLGLITSPDVAARTEPGSDLWRAIERLIAEPPTRRGTTLQLAAALRHWTWHRLSRITSPTQIQHGTADPIFSVRTARALASAIPDAQLILHEGVGHAVGLEHPPSVELALDFLEQHDTLAT